jgi:hypothetical protein
MITPWKGSEFSEAVDKHVVTMPDRLPYVLAILKFYISDGDLDFTPLEPFSKYGLRALPLTYLNCNVMVMLYGFEVDSSTGFMGVMTSLPSVKMDEAVLYVNGAPTLHILKVGQD